MDITKEYLLEQIKRMEEQRQHAHEVAIASQAAVDVLQSLLARLDLTEEPVSIPGYEIGDAIPINAHKLGERHAQS
jgi:hypothetical protein